jgi:hypothetical protein
MAKFKLPSPLSPWGTLDLREVEINLKAAKLARMEGVMDSGLWNIGIVIILLAGAAILVIRALFAGARLRECGRPYTG